MNRRGFLGFLAGAAATPLARLLPAPIAPAVAAPGLTSMTEILKKIYSAESVGALVIVNSFHFRNGGPLPASAMNSKMDLALDNNCPLDRIYKLEKLEGYGIDIRAWQVDPTSEPDRA